MIYLINFYKIFSSISVICKRFTICVLFALLFVLSYIKYISSFVKEKETDYY